MKKTKQYVSQALFIISLILITGALLACSMDTSSDDDDDSSSGDGGGTGGTGTGSTYTINVTGATTANDAYIMNGTDANGAVNGNNPGIAVYPGESISFVVNTPGHPFELVDTGDNLIAGVTNQGTTSGTVTWTATNPGEDVKYQCKTHGLAMSGRIVVQIR